MREGVWIMHTDILFIVTYNLLIKTHTCTHCQSGLTALKVAQSEAHEDICDILLQYTRQGANTQQKRRESEKEKEGETNRQQQETNTELTEVRRACLHDDFGCRSLLLAWFSCRFKRLR